MRTEGYAEEWNGIFPRFALASLLITCSVSFLTCLLVQSLSS